MHNSSQTFLKKILNIVLLFAIIIAMLGFFTDLRNTIKTGGVDLRNRVVGARLLSRGLDPYYYKWTPGQDEKLLDPLDKPELPFSRVTVPPSILLLHLPLANLPYFSQRVIWLFLQWGALICSCLLLIKANLNNLKQKLLWITVLIFIFGNNFWRLHTGVGQIYVFYVLFLSLAYWISQKNIKHKDIIIGCLIGFTASIRLPIIVMILPMIIFKKFKVVTATLSGLCLSLFVFFIFTGQKAWGSYFSAMSTIGKMNLVAKQSHNVDKFVMPTIIEGMNNLTIIPKVSFSNTSLQDLSKNILGFTINGSVLIGICCLFLVLLSIMFNYCYRTNNPKYKQFAWDIFFLVGTLMILIVDFFIPAPRYTYNDIQFLIPLFLVLKNINFFNNKSISYICLLILGLFLTNGMFSWIPRGVQVGDFLFVSAMILVSLNKNVLFAKTDSESDIIL